MTRKYIFFDIDGTLTDLDSGEVPQSAFDAIRKLEENGHFCCIATGRAHYKSESVREALGFKNMISNGGYCFTIDGKVVKNAPLRREQALALVKQADELGMGVLVSPDDSIDVVCRDEKFVEQVGLRREPTRYFLRRDMAWEDLPDFYKLYIACPPEREKELTLLDTLGHIRFVPPYIIFQHDSKDKGIRDMVAMLGGDTKDVIVFGDGENDMCMFGQEWTSVAMRSGYEPLKEMADYITDAPIDNGIYNACVHFGLIDND